MRTLRVYGKTHRDHEYMSSGKAPTLLTPRFSGRRQAVDEFKWGTRLLLNKPVANSSARDYGEAKHLDLT